MAFIRVHLESRTNKKLKHLYTVCVDLPANSRKFVTRFRSPIKRAKAPAGRQPCEALQLYRVRSATYLDVIINYN